MCDYSLMHVKSRPASVGDKLRTTNFGTGTRGFAAPSDPGTAVCVLPGNDKTHSIAAGLGVHRLIPGAELHELRNDQLDADLIPMAEWASDEKLAPVVVGFLRRVAAAAQAA